VGDPRIDDLLRRIVVAQGLDQDLPASIELPPENTMGPVSFIQRSAGVLDGRTEVLRCMLVFEAFDAGAFRAGEQKANHHVAEAPVNEIVHDGSKLWLPAELFKEAHLGDDPDAM